MVETPSEITAAFDEGINFFFVTADMHWPYYDATRRGLRQLLKRNRKVRSRIVVAVVSYATQPEFCWHPFVEVLEAIPELRYIDLTVAGGAYGHEFPTRLEVFRAQLKQRHVGVRAIGATFHDRTAAAQSIEAGSVDLAFIRYNPSHPGAQQDVFPSVNGSNGTLLYGFKSLGRVITPARCRDLGLSDEYWFPQPTDYYRFALTRTAMDGVLCAPRTPAQMRQLDAALERGPLDQEEEEYLVDLARLDSGLPPAS